MADDVRVVRQVFDAPNGNNPRQVKTRPKFRLYRDMYRKMVPKYCLELVQREHRAIEISLHLVHISLINAPACLKPPVEESYIQIYRSLERF